MTKKSRILISVQPGKGYAATGARGPAASGDIYLLLHYLKDDLQDPAVTFYVLTERVCKAWLGPFKATVFVDLPTRANIKYAFEMASAHCSSDGSCVAWISCNGARRKLPGWEGPVFFPLDGEASRIRAHDLREWTASMPISSQLGLVFEVCYADSFMELSFQFQADGRLISIGRSDTYVIRGPRVVCISACRKGQKAWILEDKGLYFGDFTIHFLEALKRHGSIPLGQIQRMLHGTLANSRIQQSIVTTNHPDDNARFSLT